MRGELVCIKLETLLEMQFMALRIISLNYWQLSIWAENALWQKKWNQCTKHDPQYRVCRNDCCFLDTLSTLHFPLFWMTGPFWEAYIEYLHRIWIESWDTGHKKRTRSEWFSAEWHCSEAFASAHATCVEPLFFIAKVEDSFLPIQGGLHQQSTTIFCCAKWFWCQIYSRLRTLSIRRFAIFSTTQWKITRLKLEAQAFKFGQGKMHNLKASTHFYLLSIFRPILWKNLQSSALLHRVMKMEQFQHPVVYLESMEKFQACTQAGSNVCSKNFSFCIPCLVSKVVVAGII